MSYVPTDPRLGLQPIANTDTTQRHALGTRIRANDPVYGDGEFIYLKGVASTVVGSVVTYDGASSGTPTYQTALAPATANLGQPLAVAMSANVANQYGWYQIAGSAVVATNGTLAAGPGKVYLAGSGQLTSTAGAGLQVLSARNDTATGTPAANQAVVQIDRPSAQGQIT